MTNREEQISLMIEDYTGIEAHTLKSMGFIYEQDAECFTLKNSFKDLESDYECEIEINLFVDKNDNMLWINNDFCSINIEDENDLNTLKNILKI